MLKLGEAGGAVEAPHLALFIASDVLQGAYVVGSGTHINCNTDTVHGAIMVLLAVYYVCDLEYPRIYSQLLGFLQKYVLQENYIQTTSVKYKMFCKKYEQVAKQ